MNHIKKVFGVLAVGVLLFVAFLLIRSSESEVKIGVVTPLSGDMAFWGESTRVGVLMAEQELARRGISATFIVEDGQLSPETALSAAAKLTGVDAVDAVYSEFNPASVAISSFLEGTTVTHVYASAAETPLTHGVNNFKTYLDYRESCAVAAKYMKEQRGIQKMGVLKINLEFGDLCLDGIRSVYGDAIVVSVYAPEDSDMRIHLQKLLVQDVDAIFHASFQEQTITSMKSMHELGMNIPFVGLSETITSQYAAELMPLIEGSVFFGLPPVADSLLQKIVEANNGANVADEHAAALAFVHLVQLGEALTACGQDASCIENALHTEPPVTDIGFQQFKNRVAYFTTTVVEYRHGVPVVVTSQ